MRRNKVSVTGWKQETYISATPVRLTKKLFFYLCCQIGVCLVRSQRFCSSNLLVGYCYTGGLIRRTLTSLFFDVVKLEIRVVRLPTRIRTNGIRFSTAFGLFYVTFVMASSNLMFSRTYAYIPVFIRRTGDISPSHRACLHQDHRCKGGHGLLAIEPAPLARPLNHTVTP